MEQAPSDTPAMAMDTAQRLALAFKTEYPDAFVEVWELSDGRAHLRLGISLRRGFMVVMVKSYRQYLAVKRELRDYVESKNGNPNPPEPPMEGHRESW